MEHLPSLIITTFGAFLGVWIGMWYTHRKEDATFNSSRKRSLKALLKSLEQNLLYLNQITNKHFPIGQLPTYPLDTVALAHFTFSARDYLPPDTDWPERYNKLRFELDHLNRKLLFEYIDKCTTVVYLPANAQISPVPPFYPVCLTRLLNLTERIIMIRICGRCKKNVDTSQDNTIAISHVILILATCGMWLIPFLLLKIIEGQKPQRIAESCPACGHIQYYV